MYANFIIKTTPNLFANWLEINTQALPFRGAEIGAVRFTLYPAEISGYSDLRIEGQAVPEELVIKGRFLVPMLPATTIGIEGQAGQQMPAIPDDRNPVKAIPAENILTEFHLAGSQTESSRGGFQVYLVEAISFDMTPLDSARMEMSVFCLRDEALPIFEELLAALERRWPGIEWISPNPFDSTSSKEAVVVDQDEPWSGEHELYKTIIRLWGEGEGEGAIAYQIGRKTSFVRNLIYDLRKKYPQIPYHRKQNSENSGD
jgi:hypothetical protein